LGYSQLCKDSLLKGQDCGNDFLEKLRNTLTNAYERIKKHNHKFNGQDSFALKIFTDNIVIGYPVDYRGFGEPELARVFGIFSEFQMSLATAGFFVRGGISYGNHFMDDDIVFGEALIDAVELNKKGGPPRIILSTRVIEIVKLHLGFYDKVMSSSHYSRLLEDADGSIFINYLIEAFDTFYEGTMSYGPLLQHRDAIIEGLEIYKSSPSVSAKYVWVARYHNYICSVFTILMEQMDGVYNEKDINEIKEYSINIESLAATPCRITLKPLFPPTDIT
jgi:hypothetical protein